MGQRVRFVRVCVEEPQLAVRRGRHVERVARRLDPVDDVAAVALVCLAE